MVLAFHTAMFGAAVAWQSQRSEGLAALWRAPVDRPVPWWAAAVAVSWILVLGPALLETRSAALRRVAAELYAAIAPITPARIALFAGLSGLCEELLFRGPLQATVSWPVAALLFGALHGGGDRRLWPWSAFAVVAGMLFGALVAVYDAISPAIVAHMTVNAINMRRLRQYAPAVARPGR
ncbi:MAG: CPBP family intramembrane metalloprotease [Deltaproteobacteria bacterium]|nr:CPBP family intramembrane metalloprotease [Deltaproteobacteria bacterium]